MMKQQWAAFSSTAPAQGRSVVLDQKFCRMGSASAEG